MLIICRFKVLCKRLSIWKDLFDAQKSISILTLILTSNRLLIILLESHIPTSDRNFSVTSLGIFSGKTYLCQESPLSSAIISPKWCVDRLIVPLISPCRLILERSIFHDLPKKASPLVKIFPDSSSLCT